MAEFMVKEAESKLALWRSAGFRPMNSEQILAAGSWKLGLSDRKMSESPCTASAPGRHRAAGIEISVEGAAGLDTVEKLDAADLDHAVAGERIEPRRLGVEHDFPHAQI
jgi:hypothetical protein